MSEEKKEFNPVKTNIVSGVVIKKDDKYLLVQEKQKHVYGLWNFPAGLVEEGLTLEENAVKEAKEETGYDVKITNKIGVFQDDVKSSAKSAFEAEIIGGELNIQKEEILSAKWFTYEEILKIKDKLRDKWVLDAINILRAKKQSEKYLDNWKRCQADFENYKKDQTKVMSEFRRFANMDMILQILPVLDSFNVSLEHVPENEKNNAWVTGITYIKKQLEDILKNYGVEEIEVKIGDNFNPEAHEAVSSDSNDAPAKGSPRFGEAGESAFGGNATNLIKKVLQKGYRIDGKVVRAAKVIVN